jgi:SAM-dependent methyltransferase
MHEDAIRIIDLYRRHAAAWARQRGSRMIERSWLDRFRNLLPQHPSVLDIGCGSGEPIARYLTQNGCDITFVDAAPEMIALCRQRFPDRTFHVADMRALSLGRRFHGLLAWDSFFHLCAEDQRRMFPVFRAHAAPLAALMFTSGPGQGEAIGTLEGEPLYHASLDPAEYRALLGENGFDVVTHKAEDPECGGHTVWLAQLTA